MTELDAKERRFVEEYLIDLKPERAAIAAGYSEKTARVKSYGWVSKSARTKPHVLEAVMKAQEERVERTKITADWVLTRLAAEAEADIADLYDENMRLKPVALWPEIWRKGLVQGLETKATVIGADEASATAEITKLKLPDRIKRLELIGKHVGVQAFVERQDHSGTVEVKNTVENPMDAARVILAALAKAEATHKESQEQET